MFNELPFNIQHSTVNIEHSVLTSNLYDLAPLALDATLREIVKPPFRAKQIEEWMHVRGVESFEAMMNIPKDIRAQLAAQFTLEFPRIVEVTPPAPDGSRKYLFTLPDNNRIESVYMPVEERNPRPSGEPGRMSSTARTSVCLSSQAGCAVGCTFCVTGFFGAGRNLTPSEMVGQFFTIVHQHQVPLELMNVVFMGMGEPLLNFENVIATLEIL